MLKFDYLLIQVHNVRVMLRFKKFFPLLIITLISTGIVYLFKPNKTSIIVFPFNVNNNVQLGCKTLLGSTMFPRQNFDKNKADVIDGSLFTNDQTKLALEINGKTLKMITTSSVEIGQTTPVEIPIYRNDDSELIAVDPEPDIILNPGLGTFILNKKTGYAVWTKSKSAFFTYSYPEVQSYYMECR